jgi:L-lactate dehydrogenase
MSSSPSPVRVVIVGAGNVGATFAYALLFRGIASEIVLIDANHARAKGEAMDLNHAEPFTNPTRAWAGDYDDCAGAAITVVCAGAGQKPGETRLDLVKKNADIFSKIIPEISRRNPDGIILVATNPVDILTQVSQKLSGLPVERVIGSGTILDTARFRHLLGKHFGVEPRSVHAYIIGEHGDSEVPVWSLANIAGLRLADYAQLTGMSHDRAIMDDIFRQTRDAAYRIIERKGATYYAVAAGLMRIVEAILRDQRTVLSVSSLITDYHGINNLCFSLPTVVGRNGIERVLRLQLDEEEQRGLQHSAEVLQKNAQSVSVRQ